MLDNGLVKAIITPHAKVISLKKAGDERDIFDVTQNKTGNNIVLFDDEPLYWDAWDVMDYHLESFKVLNTPEVR